MTENTEAHFLVTSVSEKRACDTLIKAGKTITVSDLHNALRGLSNLRGHVREPLCLADGTKLSVQASTIHYSIPREDNLAAYSSYEVAILGPEGLIYDPDAPFAYDADSDQNGCVYAYVEPEDIVKYINSKGGLS